MTNFNGHRAHGGAPHMLSAASPPQPALAQRLSAHFLQHQRAWCIGLLLCWANINILVLATTMVMEDRRGEGLLPLWQPFCWEITSIAVLLLLLPLVLHISDRYLQPLPWPKQLAAHLLMTLPFSAVHVAGMVALRHVCHRLAGGEYHFGKLPYEFFYEYLKDLQTYITMAVVVSSYRFIVRRLGGEASLLSQPEYETESSHKPVTRLLVKKLNKEFLIKVCDIEWIEAAGNYANLHVAGRVYPLRMTMAKLEHRLPNHMFARIHRSSIVNLNAVECLHPLDAGDYEVVLKSATQLSLSRRYRESFKQRVSLASTP